MVHLPRTLDLNTLLSSHSFFLLGPRATGKSSLIRAQLGKKAVVLDLLRSELFLRLNAEPWQLESLIRAKLSPDPTLQTDSLIIIDEIQKIPLLLNEVHRLIEEYQWRFLLTGSSTRQLRKNNVNLLAGRAWEARLFPLTRHEIPNFSLTRYLQYGGLPSVYLHSKPNEVLDAYVNTYLKEEIQAEALVRKVHTFGRFLQMASMTSGQTLNFNTLASDTGIPASTVREYYKILEDTLIGSLLPVWQKSIKRKAMTHAKFYFFDIGIRNQLANIHTLEPQSDLYGHAFEHFIAMELHAYLSYTRKKLPLSYWRTVQGDEVDFIVGDELAIEVKTHHNIKDKHLKGLQTLQEENLCSHLFLISFDPVSRFYEGIHILPWEVFLDRLWNGTII